MAGAVSDIVNSMIELRSIVLPRQGNRILKRSNRR